MTIGECIDPNIVNVCIMHLMGMWYKSCNVIQQILFEFIVYIRRYTYMYVIIKLNSKFEAMTSLKAG